MILSNYFSTTNLIILTFSIILILILYIIINKDIKKSLKFFSKITITIGIVNLVLCLFISKIITTILSARYLSILSISVTDNINKIMLINSFIYIGVGMIILIIYKLLNKKTK